MIVPNVAAMKQMSAMNTGDVCVAGGSDGGIHIYDATKANIDDGGVIQKGHVRQFTGSIHAKWFGVVSGDPSKAALNSIAIAKAIAYAKSVGGGRVVLPPGQVWIGSTLDLTRAVCVVLEGAGQGYFDELSAVPSRLVWDGASGGTMVKVHETDHSGVERIALDGQYTAGVGLAITATVNSTPCKHGTFRDVFVCNCTDWGIDFGDSTNADISGHIFDHIRVFGCGIRQRGTQTASNYWRDTIVAGWTTYGLAIYGGTFEGTEFQFAAYDNAASADVYIANTAGTVRIAAYHETYGTAYAFETFAAGVTENRPLLTEIRSRVLWLGATSVHQPASANVVDFQQTGSLRLHMEVDGFNGASPCYVNLRPPYGANPGSFDVDVRCLNGASVKVPDGALSGGTIRNAVLNGINLTTVKPTGDVATPNSDVTHVGCSQRLHNSPIIYSDTRGGGNAYASQSVASNAGCVEHKEGETRAAGALIERWLSSSGSQLVAMNGAGGVGMYGANPPSAKPTVTGSRSDGAALASLLTALASFGLITDASSA